MQKPNLLSPSRSLNQAPMAAQPTALPSQGRAFAPGFSLGFSPGVAFKALCLTVGSIGLLGLGGCGQPQADQSQTDPTQAADDQSGIGQLEIRANGEDFVRDGFTSKDGWAISFDNLYVGLAEVTALQTSPPFDPDNPDEPNIAVAAEQPEATVVDLADDAAPTALVAQFPEVEAGRYNALGWSVVPAASGPSQGQSLRLVGQASKGADTINFTLDWDESYQYLCGDFIGDQRKGILKAGDSADLEATFHFDHVFGDGDAAPDDAINQKSLGFEPLVALAADGTLNASRSDLQAQLSPEDFTTLETAIAGLAHVGEGHCRQVASASTSTLSSSEVNQ